MGNSVQLVRNELQRRAAVLAATNATIPSSTGDPSSSLTTTTSYRYMIQQSLLSFTTAPTTVIDIIQSYYCGTGRYLISASSFNPCNQLHVYDIYEHGTSTASSSSKLSIAGRTISISSKPVQISPPIPRLLSLRDCRMYRMGDDIIAVVTTTKIAVGQPGSSVRLFTNRAHRCSSTRTCDNR